jgi:hypothetical protein
MISPRLRLSLAAGVAAWLSLAAGAAWADAPGLCGPNSVMAGPASGVPAAPLCRALIVPDIPPGVVGYPPGVTSPDNYRNASEPDDTGAIQRALSTCKNVLLSNKTYVVSSTMYFCPGGNQTLAGYGAASVIQPSATWNAAGTAGHCSATSDNATWDPIFANTNCGGVTATQHGSVFADKHIEVKDLHIDGNKVPGTVVGSLIGVFVRNAQFVRVSNISCDKLADCTAFLASADTLVESSVAANSLNGGFDHWDSPTDASAINDTVYCTTGAGFLFNAADTTATHDGVGINYQVIGSRALNCPTGFFIDPLTAGGIIQNVSIVGVLVDAEATSANGIVLSGNVQQGAIVAPQFRDFTDSPQLLYIGTSSVGTFKPTGVTVTAPQFVNVTISSGSIAPIHVLGAPTTRITGTNFTSVATPYAVDTDSTGAYFDGAYPVGSVGLVNLHGSFPDFHNQNFVNVTVASCGGTPSIGGISNKFSGTVGTGTVTSCQVNFPSGAWAYAPTCNITPGTAGDQLAITSLTASAMVFASLATMATHTFSVICVQ